VNNRRTEFLAEYVSVAGDPLKNRQLGDWESPKTKSKKSERAKAESRRRRRAKRRVGSNQESKGSLIK